MLAKRSSASIPMRSPKTPSTDASDTREGGYGSFLFSISYAGESGGFSSLPRTDHLPRRDMNVRNWWIAVAAESAWGGSGAPRADATRRCTQRLDLGPKTKRRLWGAPLPITDIRRLQTLWSR
jgi:hypothetical protein